MYKSHEWQSKPTTHQDSERFFKTFSINQKIFQVNRFKSYQLQFTAYQIQAGQMVFVRLDI